MSDRPRTVQAAAGIPAGREESPVAEEDEMCLLSVPRHRPLHDWIATRTAWPVDDVDILPVDR
ncbi:hypothetical protein GCM10009565_88850 [Amycolatopsis albidoflavus]